VSASQFLLDELPDRAEFALTGSEGHHAARVQRIRAGETVLVGDGRGTVLTCVVRGVGAEGLTLDVRARRTEPEPQPRVVVVQALPKSERADLTVELLTELGVDEIVPWAASRCVAQWHGARGDKALEKWRRTAREAAKQSRRPWVPVITELHSTADVAARLSASSAGLVLHEEAEARFGAVPLPPSGEVVLIVGPEGGVAADEVAAFTAGGAFAVRLGEPVLRTSTAGAAAVAAVSLRLGRWG
jgi:16S rRNA (uracil1498-N3)-methyltransferase